MNISINPDYLNNPAEFSRILHILSAHREKHSLSINTTKLSSRLANSQIFPLFNELVILAINRQYENEIEVTINPKNKKQISLQNLNDYLSRPAVLVVENGTSDRAFIKCIINTLKDYTLIDGIDKSWEIRTAGGCGEIPKVMFDEVRKFSFYPRVCVIHDSDKEYPACELNPAHKKIETDAEKYGIHSVLLSKREIENYIPTSSLVTILSNNHSGKLDSFNKLNIEQKDYFDYKKGFSTARQASITALYNDIEADDILRLYDGFGKKISDTVFQDSSKFTIEDFKERCSNILSEFESICQGIRKIL